jgi:hypothetical protein
LVTSRDGIEENPDFSRTLTAAQGAKLTLPPLQDQEFRNLGGGDEEFA